MKHQNLEFKWMCLLFLALLLSPPLLWGQNHSIKGQIVDAKSNEPLIGVNITVEGTSNGTISDIDGRFTLSVAANAVLKISYIGYQEKKIKVDDLKKEPIISLEEDSKQLEEVVVVGYGIQKKVSSVGAITQTKGEELLKGGNITSVSEALQGKLNGLVAINTSGKPGASDTKMYIRGKASWQNSDPLVLVDGIERDMNDVDMNEIESISILKDASATADILHAIPPELHAAAEYIIYHWNEPIVPITGTADVVRELKARGYTLYLLSNAARRQHTYWHDIPGSECFSGTLISADVHLLKPEAAIYQALFDKFDLTAASCLFVDDFPPNIEAAENAGMQGIVFHDAGQLREELKARGIL